MTCNSSRAGCGAHGGSSYAIFLAASLTAAGAAASQANAAGITINQVSSTDWNINNGSLNIVFDPKTNNITSIKVGTSSSNILDPSNSQLYPEFAGTPFGAGNQTYSYTLGPNNSYIDFSTTTASAGNATYSNGTLINPITYAFHYIMYANDPSISCYEVLNHSATDPATSVGQGQFLLRVNPALMTNTYQVNTGPNNLGVQTSTFRNPTIYAADEGVAARQVENAVTDLTGSLPGDFGTNFATKYDFSSYEQFHQAQLEYGSTYALSTLMTNQDTMTGGPTKQNLQFTDTILMQEFLSGHYGTSTYGYTPTQGVNTSRLFGPYVFRVVPTNGESASQLYQDDLNALPTYQSLFNSDTTLLANGYVPSTARGSFQVTIANPAGWTSNTTNQTVVLSDPNTNFQYSSQGPQYWAQIGQNGTANISSVSPGTYRMSIYQLGQWGETRVDGVTVSNGKLTVPQNVTFTPENFSTSAPIFTLGTPNRSANEFLNGHNSSGGDLREYQGSYNYWAQEQTLGNPGKVVYYATAVGSTPATNNPSAWIANQWGTFDPGLYDAANNTTDNYANLAPAYVTAGGATVATYSGAPWEVHFTTTQAQLNQGQYTVLSVALAAAEASLIVTLNGHQEIWHYSNSSDPSVRSGVAGYYQWIAFQFPTADLLAAGQNDVITFSVSQSEGVMYDALRLEITPNSASPATTGWNDYTYVTGSNSQSSPNDALGQTNTQLSGTTLLGDANLDGKVDLSDLNILLNNLGQTTGDYTKGNFDGQPTIDLTDLNDVLNNLGTTLANNASNSPSPASPAPEPASLALLAAGTVSSIVRRQRRRRV
jgi:hypothetical protein